MENVIEIVQQQAEDALKALEAQGVVTAEYIADSVLRRTAYWEKLMPNGEKLLFIRFFSPVVQREEVFLGNILFNAFLSKAFARAVTDSKLGKAELVANDLENYYFLVRTKFDLTQLVEAFRAEVERSLPDLFFGEQDETKGIYGSLETMLDFDKANVEPFPVFIMPRAYAERLEKAVRESLLRKIEKSRLDRNPTSIMANLAFFYSRDGAEMQSPPKFLGHLTFQHSVISPDELETALNIPQTEQQHITDLIRDEEQFNTQQKKALNDLIRHLDTTLSTHSRFGWLELFFKKTDKGAWELDVGKPKEQKAVARLLSKVQQMSSKIMFDEIIKSVIAHRLSRDIDACSKQKLTETFRKAVTNLGRNVEQDPGTWLMPYIRDKFLTHDEKTLTDALLDGVSLGYVRIASPKKAVDVGCRVCGVKPMEAEDKSILMGQNTHKFHNQAGKQSSSDDPKACLRCATCTYLMVKLIGSEAIGQPQVPKTYNLIFHYGKHDDAQVEALTHQIDLIWNLVQTHQQKERDAATIRKAVNEAKKKLEQEEDEQKKARLAQQLQAKQEELQQKEAAIEQAGNDLFKVCPWLAEPTPPSESCSLEVLAVSKLGEAKTERHILGLGMGGYRMILFILPQLEPPRSKKKGEPPPDPYLTQRRFSDSRVTVTALLSFLRELCGCDGPFYYQSLPTLTPDAFQRDTFYVRNEPISVKEAQEEYEVVTQLAWKLVWQRGGDGFVRKVVLAEKLLEDPLGTFAAVMRDSAILGQTKGSYKRLVSGYREDWKTQDLTEYAKFIQKLSKLQEVK